MRIALSASDSSAVSKHATKALTSNFILSSQVKLIALYTDHNNAAVFVKILINRV